MLRHFVVVVAAFRGAPIGIAAQHRSQRVALGVRMRCSPNTVGVVCRVLFWEAVQACRCVGAAAARAVVA